jgi:hypothetical protein
MMSTNALVERRGHFYEQARFFHSNASTRGSRSEARARFHLNILDEMLAQRAKADREKHSFTTCDFGGPPKDRSKFSLGDLLAAKGQKLGSA